MAETREQGQVRLAELVAALSLGIDLGFGQPMEHVLRQCLIALRIAERVELDDDARAAVYYTALLVSVGCHSDAHEQAKWFGDDISLKATKYEHEPLSLSATAAILRRIGAGNPPLHRIRTGLEFAVSGHREVNDMIAQHARLARSLGEQLGLPGMVLDGLAGSYERWDGRGWPGALAGANIPMASRVAQMAEYLEVAHRTGGIDAALSVAERRSGTQFDPSLVAMIGSDPRSVFDGIDAVGTWNAVVSAEPALAVVLSNEQFDAALQAIATFADLKSPYTLGHSRAVAELAAAAAVQAGFPDAEVRTLRHAGLVHDFGRLGVSNAIWDKATPLGAGEWERIRMHPYITERMLQQSEVLAPLGRIAVQHRERMDGSGYPRGLPGNAITPAARILGASDAYQAMREPRPYRPARSRDEAAAELQADVRAGRLVISPKTAGNHIEHIYTKIDVSNRATASLFAMQHGLLPEEELAATRAS